MDQDQEISESITFTPNAKEGIFTINVTRNIDSKVIFMAKGELTFNGTRIIEANYDEKALYIESDKSSVTVSIGTVSANFTLNVETAHSDTYEIILTVKNQSRTILSSGKSLNIVSYVNQLPPTVSFTAQIRKNNETTPLAWISGNLDFVKGIGLNIKSQYEEPITYLNLQIQRMPTMLVSKIPNTQIVKIPEEYVTLSEATNPIGIAIGTPLDLLPESIEIITTSSSTSIQTNSASEDLINLTWIYEIFESNWNIMLGSVLLMFIAAVFAKRIL